MYVSPGLPIYLSPLVNPLATIGLLSKSLSLFYELGLLI